MNEKEMTSEPEDLFSKFKGTSIFPNSEDEIKKQEVRELALKIFKRKLGFTFKKDVKPETIDQLVASEPFQEYIRLAEKQLEKRGQALVNNKHYPVIEVPADGKKGMGGGAYVLCFVYSKYRGNFVLKGYYREVKAYLKKNYTHYFCNISMQWMGSHRDFWGFWKESIGVHEPSRYRKGVSRQDQMFSVRRYVDWNAEDNEYKKANAETLRFKRMPKRWIPEFDNF